MIGHITEYEIPFTGAKGSNFSLPIGTGGKALLACVIRKGDNVNLYAAHGLRNQLVKLEMKTKEGHCIQLYSTHQTH